MFLVCYGIFMTNYDCVVKTYGDVWIRNTEVGMCSLPFEEVCSIRRGSGKNDSSECRGPRTVVSGHTCELSHSHMLLLNHVPLFL